jgi:hypothetical protein
MRQFAIIIALLVTTPGIGAAQDMQILGFGRLFNNDRIGDGGDKWRSGSYQFSVIRGQEWSGDLPDRPFAMQEFRFRSEIIAPRTDSIDRPYVGALSVGLHTHFGLGPFDASVGADMTAIGPQTGVSALQEQFHEVFSIPDPKGTESQLENAVHFSGTTELNWPLQLSEMVTIRPFAEGQAGVETLARIGADVIVGQIGHSDLLLRDPVTGQLIRGVEGEALGVSLVAGADYARVTESVFLPEDRGFAPTDDRFRVRAGLHWQLAPLVSFFYGATYLSEEFVGQDEGQIVGGLKLNFNF